MENVVPPLVSDSSLVENTGIIRTVWSLMSSTRFWSQATFAEYRIYTEYKIYTNVHTHILGYINESLESWRAETVIYDTITSLWLTTSPLWWLIYLTICLVYWLFFVVIINNKTPKARVTKSVDNYLTRIVHRCKCQYYLKRFRKKATSCTMTITWWYWIWYLFQECHNNKVDENISQTWPNICF